jgi:hypothetical protein
MKFLLLSPLFVTGFLLLIALGGEIVHRLWNGLLPELFGLPAITFWQALGLLALSRILVGGFGLGGGSHNRSHRCDHASDRLSDRIADRVADRVAERVERMTPEQRERFRQRLRERGVDVGGANSAS